MSCQGIRLRRYIHRNCLQIFIIRNMHDQRIIRWTAFCSISLLRCLLLQRIRSQSVDCLRRKCYKPAILQNISCLFDYFRINIIFIYFSYYRFHKFYYNIFLLKKKLFIPSSLLSSLIFQILQDAFCHRFCQLLLIVF